MGILEDRNKKHTRRVRIQDALLLTLYGTTLLSTALLAPNAVRLLKHIDPDFAKKRRISYRMGQALKRLESRGLVDRKKSDKGWNVQLTSRGKILSTRLQAAQTIMIRKPRRWDGKWRVVIFDIWEKRKGVREKLRVLLVKAGFVRVQDSVWIQPYPCEEFIVFIRNDLRLGSGILYLIAEGIEHDQKLRAHFKLK